MPSHHSLGIIFVGAFEPTLNNTWGGQVQACRSLLKEAEATTNVEWFLIDTRMRTLPPPSTIVRGWDAFLRTVKFVWLLLTRRVDGVLIFTGMGPTGVLEKGMMCLIGRCFGKRIVLAPRSEVRRFRGAAVFLNPFFQWVLWSCRGVICQSAEAKERLRNVFRCPERKLHLIPAWIDATPYQSLARQRTRPNPGEPFTFLYLGWLVTYKGVYELLSAFEAVSRKSSQPCRLILCGHGEELDRMKEWVKARNLASQVDFRGWVDFQGKLRALGESDVFVLPSHTEGLPNALLEAMASRLPCITTPVGGIPSLIEHEVNGLLVPPKDAESLEAAMMRLLSDPSFSSNLAMQGVLRVETSHQLTGAFGGIADLLGLQVIERESFGEEGSPPAVPQAPMSMFSDAA